MTASIEDIRKVISDHRSFVLTTHVNPDGDGLGSELALAYFLRDLGKKSAILNHNETPENYRWLDGEGLIGTFDPKRDGKQISDADVIFILDTNQPDRLRSLGPFVLQSKATKVVIDHHLQPHKFADYYLIDDGATSTGEIIYRLLNSFGGSAIGRPGAIALYTAIMTDTGSFRYPRTDSDTHEITADLLSRGVDPTETYINVYESWTEGRMRLLGEALDTLKTMYNGRLAYIVCTQKMFKATGTTEVETDNFTVYPMSVRGVLVGILFNELEDGVKMSFRSRGTIPVNELAKEFGGNGHLNAAGARLFNVGLRETVDRVLQKVALFLPK